MPKIQNPYIYGAKGKVAIVGSAPALSDFHRWLHPEIAIAAAPLPLGKLDADNLKAMDQAVYDLFQMIARFEKPDLSFFSCTSGSLIGGAGYDDALSAGITEKASTEAAYTTSTAIRYALDIMGSKRLSIITPYPDEVNQIERQYFDNNGYRVDQIHSIKTADPSQRSLIYRISPQQIYDFALTHTDPNSDICFISCTGLRALPAIHPLEAALGIPVLTSNQAAIWLIGNYFNAHHPETTETLGCLFKHSLKLDQTVFGGTYETADF